MHLQKRLTNTAFYCIALVQLVAVVSFAGWLFNSFSLKHPLPGLVAMNPLTALLFIIAGIAFQAFSSGGYQRTANLLSFIVCVIALTKVISIFIDLPFTIDAILFKSQVNTDISNGLPNRIAPNTAACFILIAFALLLLHSSRITYKKIAHQLSLVIFMISLLSILGYIYGVKSFYGVMIYMPMAIQTAFCFLLFSLAILFAQPNIGFMSVFTGSYSGSITARMFIPAIIIIPAAFGLFVLYAYWQHFFSTEFSMALLVLGVMIVFTALIWYTTLQLNHRDIRHREAEDILRRREEQVNTIFNTAPDAMILIDREGLISLANKQAYHLFGYSKEELIGKEANLLLPAEIRSLPIFQASKQVANMKEPVHDMQLFALKKGDIIFPVEVNVSQLSTQGEEQVLVAFRDITQRRELENELKQFNEELEAQVIERTQQLVNIFERVSDAFMAFDKDWHYRYVNARAGELIRRDPELLIGKHVWTEFPKEINETFYNACHRAMQQQEQLNYQDYYAPYEKWFDINLYPSDNGLSVYFKDITESKQYEDALKHSADKYRMLFESNPLSMWVFDLETFLIIDVNHAAILHYGYSREEFLSMTIQQIRPPEDKESVIAFSQKNIEGIRHAGVWRHIRKDRSIILVEVTSHDILYQDKHSRLILANDVTAKINAEQHLLASNEQLRKLSARMETLREEERKHIAREIHDELGQMITGLKMDIVWLQKNLPQSTPEIQSKLKDSTELINSSIKTVRKIATELRPSILDDLGLIAALEWLSSDFQKKTGLTCIFNNYAGELRLGMPVQTALFRIYQESLTNIMRHSNATLVNTSMSIDENFVTLKIQDNGKGFDTHQQKETLGLLGMKERASIINGTFTVSSTPEKGTIVSVNVPL